MNWKQRRSFIFACLAIVALVLTACGGETAVAEPTATDTPADTQTEPTAAPTTEPTEEPTAEPTETPTEEPMVEPAITVTDQTLGEGNTVTVPAVTAAEDGWMVIHADADGAPGPVVGQAPVTSGENADVTVEIDPEAATETLYAMLHVDAGEAGTYEFPGDDGPVRDAEGNVVVRPFAVEGLAMTEMEEETAEPVSVAAVDSAFEPVEVTVPAGTTVVWTNEGQLAHTVTADDEQFASGSLDPGATFELTFDTPGEYPYYCRFHGGPGGVGMAGTIIVEE